MLMDGPLGNATDPDLIPKTYSYTDTLIVDSSSAEFKSFHGRLTLVATGVNTNYDEGGPLRVLACFRIIRNPLHNQLHTASTGRIYLIFGSNSRHFPPDPTLRTLPTISHAEKRIGTKYKVPHQTVKELSGR